MSLPATLYHGTSTGYLEQILRDGICPPYPQVRPEPGSYTCWTDTWSVAEFHAHHMEENDSDVLERECDPVVFAVPIASFRVGSFVLEQNFVRIGVSGVGGRNESVELRGKKWNWRKLLKFTGGVGYEAPLAVKPEMIVRLIRRPNILFVETPN